MPISSLEIANMNGAYMQQGMLLQQNAAMIGSLGSPQSGAGETIGGHVAGRALNIGTAVGGPGMAMMAGLAGIDPMSMAFKGAQMGFKGGGLAGGALGGLALGGATMGAGMAVNYAVDQMTRGIQQQQQLHQMMGQSFKFQNQFGGTGFSSGETRQIGAGIANMQGWSGPGQTGQMMGFEELSRLAANMGAMGMGQGVKNVQDFSKRFKEMLGAVKEISHTMQTSLEEAQKMMSDMRGSGVFGAGNASSMARQVRAAAVGGGIATTEVTAMMGIGSQLARMTGGLGRQGAAAGIRAIGQVGAAQEAGVISEESIYNVTGLTGAEGRQAYAMRGMQKSDEFLRTAQGRWFMASVAGKGGKVNEGNILEYLSGGTVSPEQTKEMANKNLAQIGRADFIRNEGRLRAAVTERLGVLAPVLATAQWLESRGLNMEDDRSRLYLQRVRGMGRDEADNMIEMGRNIPRILEQQRSAQRQDKISHDISSARSNTGIEGLKRKFESAREDVQKKLAEPARALFQWADDAISSTVASITGSFVTAQYKNIDELTRTAKGSGTAATQARDQLLGRLGTSKNFGALKVGGDLGFGGSAGAEFMQNVGQVDALKEAGFDLKTTQRNGRMSSFRSDADISKQLDAFKAISDGVAEGSGQASDFGKAKAMQLLEFAGREGLGKGTQTLGRYEEALRRMAASGDKDAAAQLQKWNQATPAGKAKMMGSDMAGAGMDVSGLTSMPEVSSITSMRKTATIEDFRQNLGAKALGVEGGEGGVLSGLVNSVFGTGSSTLERHERAKAMGTAMDNEDFLNLGQRALSRSDTVRDETRKEMLTESAKLLAQDRKPGSAEQGRFDAIGNLLMAQDLDKALSGKTLDQLTQAEKDQLVRDNKKYGITDFDDLKTRAGTTRNYLLGAGAERSKQVIADIKETASENRTRMQRSGIISVTGGVSNDIMKSLGGADTPMAKYAAAKARAAEQGALGTAAGAEASMKAEQEASELRHGMSTDDLKKLEEGLGTDRVLSGDIRSERQQRQRLGRRGSTAQGLSLLAGELGIKTDKRELLKAAGKGDKGIDAMIAQMAADAGIKDPGQLKALSDAAGAYVKTGKTDGLTKALGDTAGARLEEKQKKSLADAEASNPLGAETNKHLLKMSSTMDKLADYAKATVQANKEATVALNEINAANKNEASGQ